MRQFIFLLILILMLPCWVSGQTWRSDIDLNVSVAPAQDKISLFTNRDGNHVLLHKGNQVVYYLFTYNGSQVRSTTIATSMNEDARLAKVTGNDENVYVIYKKGGYIYTKKSTNAGQSWSNIETITMSHSASNGMEVWSDDNGVHLVWSEDAGYYETIYCRLPHNETYWTDAKEVTDSSGDYGGFPNVTTSANRVHVAYTQGAETRPHYNRGQSKTRDKYSGSWQAPQNIFNDTNISMVIATGSKLHNFYYDYVEGWGQWHSDLYYKSRNLGSTTWSSSILIQDFSDPDYGLIGMAVSNNDHLHIFYKDWSGISYKVWDGNWSSATNISEGYYTNQRISANGNDVYVLWFDDTDNKIRLKQRDFAPIVPTGLAISSNANGNAVLTWHTNPEADLKEYRIYRKWVHHSSYQHVGITSNTTWTDEILLLEQGDLFSYYIKAVDQTNNYSASSDTVTCYAIWKKADRDFITRKRNIPNHFALYPCFPNPFNATTQISFDLPVANHVSLQIYNLNGQLIATAANSLFEAGRYSIQFDASGLSSGIYLYKISAGNFMEVKRMLLVK
jgi:hypothetical protein